MIKVIINYKQGNDLCIEYQTKIKMKTIKEILFITTLLIGFIGLNKLQAQEYVLNKNKSSLVVYGTSNLHDWHVTAEDQQGSLIVEDMVYGKVGEMKILIPAESLKSGRSGMDKNTFKALKTKKYKNIYFELTSVKNIENQEDGRFYVKTNGKLTIAGTTQNIPLNFTMEIKDAETITITGSKKVTMTDYRVDPPKALLGTIKTGEDVILKFKTIFNIKIK